MLFELALVAGALAVGLALVALVYVLGMRTKSRFVLTPLIELQRRFINPRQMKSAGSPGAYASVVRHRGRKSGRQLETPVGVVATGDGFVIAMVYGSRTNWVRNVLADGTATVIHEGNTYPVDQPQIVPMESVAALFPAGDRRGFRVLAVSEALRLRRAGSASAGARQRAALPAVETRRVPAVDAAGQSR